MNEQAVRRATVDFLSNADPNAVFVNLPSGSGVLHIANTEQQNWISGFVGTSAGRWKIAGEEKRHFGDSAQTCAMELVGLNREALKYTVFEEWEITADTAAINVGSFPQPLQKAYFEDKGPAPWKWAKSHILVEELQNTSAFRGNYPLIAPSASGLVCGFNGLVLVTDPRSTPMRMIRTGAYNDFF